MDAQTQRRRPKAKKEEDPHNQKRHQPSKHPNKEDNFVNRNNGSDDSRDDCDDRDDLDDDDGKQCNENYKQQKQKKTSFIFCKVAIEIRRSDDIFKATHNHFKCVLSFYTLL